MDVVDQLMNCGGPSSEGIRLLFRARDNGLISTALLAAVFSDLFDLDFWDPDGVTEPAGPDTDGLKARELTRAQRKRDGVCPECGDRSEESAVGVCKDHGRFFG